MAGTGTLPRIALIAAGLLLCAGTEWPVPNPLVGKVEEVKNGNTLVIDGELIRLWGIDVPDLDQPCNDADRQPFRCGMAARTVLEALTRDRVIVCDIIRLTPTMVPQGICSLEGTDLQARMVSLGFAFDDRDVSGGLYFADEARAEQRRMGLWSGAFVTPVQWRRFRRGTVSLSE